MNQMFFGNSRVMLFTPNGGSTPAIDPAKTRFTLEGGTVEEYDISGNLDRQWLVDHGYFDSNNYEWLKNITEIDFGNTVTSITNNDGGTFWGNMYLTRMSIPMSILHIGLETFAECSSLQTITTPKTKEQFYGILDQISDINESDKYGGGFFISETHEPGYDIEILCSDGILYAMSTN